VKFQQLKKNLESRLLVGFAQNLDSMSNWLLEALWFEPYMLEALLPTSVSLRNVLMQPK
jgi:hypothetical protein